MAASRRCPFSQGVGAWSFCLLGFLAHVCLAVPPSVTVPAFVWSDQPLINGQNGVDYEMLSQESFSEILFHGLLKLDASKSVHGSQHRPFIKPSVEAMPQVILAAVGDQFSGGILTQSEDKQTSGSAISMIKTWLSTAISSITISYVDVRMRQRPLASNLVATFKHAVKEAGKVGKVVVLGDCQLDDVHVVKMSSMQELKDFLQSKPISENGCDIILVVVCAKAAASEDNQLQAEVSIAEGAHLAVKDSKLPYVAVFTADPKYVAGLETRVLDEAYGGNQSMVCDETCRTRATILEGVFAGIVLLLILISGIWCMVAIDTPGRFEAPKES